MSRLGGAGAVAPLVTDMPLPSSVEVKRKYQRFRKWGFDSNCLLKPQ